MRDESLRRIDDERSLCDIIQRRPIRLAAAREQWKRMMTFEIQTPSDALIALAISET